MRCLACHPAIPALAPTASTPLVPPSSGAMAQASPHMWQLALPTDLEAGEHTVEVTGTDRYGVTYTDTFTFTVEAEGTA